MSTRTKLLNEFERMLEADSPDENIEGMAACETMPGKIAPTRVHTRERLEIESRTAGILAVNIRRSYLVWYEADELIYGLAQKPTVDVV